MKLPRDLSGRDLARALIPDHQSLRVGTLAAILAEVGAHFQLDRTEIVRRLFGE